MRETERQRRRRAARAAAIDRQAGAAGRDWQASRAAVLARRALALVLAERERWVLWLPVLFGGGIGVYFALPIEPPIWTGPSVVGFVVLLAMAGRLRAPVLVPCLVVGVAAGGFAAAQARTALVAAPVLASETRAIPIIGTVHAVEPRETGVRLRLSQVEIPDLSPGDTPAFVRVTVSAGAPGVEAGDRVRARAVLRPPPAPVAPGAFDFARYAFFRQIGAVGFVLGRVEVLPAPPPATGAWATAERAVSGFRHDLAQTLRGALDGDTGAIAAALMTGERGAVSEATLTALRDAGLAHLLAISGLHVGLIAGLVFFTVRAGGALVPYIALRYPLKKIAAVAALLAAAGYTVLVGATVPTQRAFLMTAIVLLGIALDRTAISMRLVAFAAFVVLALHPESLLSVSFQMSFAATIALVATYEALRDNGVRLAGERRLAGRIGLYLAGVALTSLVAAAATGPFALYHFNRVALYGLAANMLAVPLMAFWVMPWALAAYVLAAIGGVGLALTPMGWGIDGILWVARTVAAWPGAAPLLPTPPTWALLLLTAGALWLCLWARRWRLIGLAPLAAGLAGFAATPAPDVLVGRDAELLAVRGADGGLWLSTTRRSRFSAEVWLRRAGQSEGRRFPRVGAAEGVDLTCDPLGCIYRRGPHTVALIRDGRALAEDCGRATLVVAIVPVRRADCAAPLAVIDRFDIWRAGGHAIFLNGAAWQVTSVRGQRGARPWVRRPEATSETAATGQ